MLPFAALDADPVHPRAQSKHSLFVNTTFSLLGPARPSRLLSSLFFRRRLPLPALSASAAEPPPPSSAAIAVRRSGTALHSASYPRRMFARRFCSLCMWFCRFCIADSSAGLGAGILPAPAPVPANASAAPEDVWRRVLVAPLPGGDCRERLEAPARSSRSGEDKRLDVVVAGADVEWDKSPRVGTPASVVWERLLRWSARGGKV